MTSGKPDEGIHALLDIVALTDPRIALLIYVTLVVIAVVAILSVARALRDKLPLQPGSGIYESGAPAHRAMMAPVSAAYFQIAAFFVIFDFEAAVLYTWSVSAAEAGWPGLISAAIFIVVLLAALVYLWADGALDTGPETRGQRL